MANPKGKNNRLGDPHVIRPWGRPKRCGPKAPRPDLSGSHDHSGKALWYSSADGTAPDSSPIHLEGLFQDPLALDRMIVLNDPLFRYFR